MDKTDRASKEGGRPIRRKEEEQESEQRRRMNGRCWHHLMWQGSHGGQVKQPMSNIALAVDDSTIGVRQWT